MSADGAIVYMLLQGFDPKYVGAYIDPGHMFIEGGLSGWKICIDLLSEYIAMVAVKSMGWFAETDEQTGEKRWSRKMLPLSEGMVRWREVVDCLRQINFDGVISVHSEYAGSHSFRSLSVEELIEQTREDLAYLREVIG